MGVGLSVSWVGVKHSSVTAKSMKSEEFEISERRTKIAQFYRRGCPYRVIANNLGCSIATVSRDIQVILAEFKEERLSSIEAVLIEQLMKIDRIESRAERQFAKSCKEAVELVEEDGEIPTGATSKKRKKTANQFGDSGFLLVEIKCVDMRLKVLEKLTPKLEASQRKKPVEVVIRSREEALSLDKFMEQFSNGGVN